MPERIRMLTVRQPWAWAIIHGGKDVENRPRNIAGDYRGPVAILAGKTWHGSSWVQLTPALREAHIAARARDGLSLPERDYKVMEPQRGRIIGVVDLVDAHGERFFGRTCACESEWADISCWHLVLANPRVLPEPIPFKGSLALLWLDEALSARILAEAVPVA